MLMKGPDLLTPLLHVLYPYREREVAITADVKEMFHQLLVCEEDRSALLYLWRNSADLPLDTMVMDVAIFGASCSPTQAQFVKNMNAMEFEHQYPRATLAIIRRHYVDDYLDSVDTIDEAVELAAQVMEVHGQAGFHIRNWISNKEEFVRTIGEGNPAVVKHFTPGQESDGERLLGMIWQPTEDNFSFALNFRDDLKDILAGDVVPTKRQILRIVMSIYDPLGLVSTFVVHGKIMIQEMWRIKIGWDEKIPTNLFTRWQQWLIRLRGMDEIEVPRCYFPGYHPSSYDTLQLHIFVDASSEAYAAVAYFRIVDRGTVRCALVSSKTKVVPLQPLSTPRAELLAAVLGARLRKTIVDGHSLKIHQTHFWCDSSTVHSWITSDLRRYRQFVALRVNEILNLSTPEEWRWIPTHLNVADEATKWGKGPSFTADCRWYRAPQFLYEPEELWPGDQETRITETDEEVRPAYVGKHSLGQPLVLVERFSKWERLHRCVAYVLRFVNRVHPEWKTLGSTVNLTKEDLLEAERVLWRLVQHEAYPDEVNILKSKREGQRNQQKNVEKNSLLYKLSPIMDEHGIIRMNSRLSAAEFLPFDTRFPIILPKDSYITRLVVDWYHRDYKHANDETVINEIKQKFHISKLRGRLSFVKKNCSWCRVYKAVPTVPQMASLPPERLTPFVRPFSYVGIDYFGPYLVKIGRASVKRWVALFTCLTIRAIHLEIAATLSTDSCKKAIRRFIARRGAPLEVFTDNGTNFVGAGRELAEEIRNLNNELNSTFTNSHTQWRFNPPAAPHMGGCWERMVRSVKVALGSVPTLRKLDEESFWTMLAEAESMINSRPLTFVPLTTDSEECLTPNHFLMMSSKGVKQPVKDPICEKAALKDSWSTLQMVLDHFWKRWLLEYLPTITRRSKWFQDVRPIKAGELVIIADEKLRNHWTRGRVVRVYTGQDGVARKADVQTSGGVLQRAVAKLAVLDLEKADDAEAELQSSCGGGCSEKMQPSVPLNSATCSNVTIV
ncbi:uncharacterized protein LOC134290641 [Aedes albopictus]|uniref:Integrase catalytic domain-containing protein n=1 Tax=Aedes albopictus TaxID=7160 RepID=A0ABM1ZKG3_AEDAL